MSAAVSVSNRCVAAARANAANDSRGLKAFDLNRIGPASLVYRLAGFGHVGQRDLQVEHFARVDPCAAGSPWTCRKSRSRLSIEVADGASRRVGAALLGRDKATTFNSCLPLQQPSSG